jgi:S-adenosylmethionine:diacylglycerol 3-amino-3-carboxypropyl transferase
MSELHFAQIREDGRVERFVRRQAGAANLVCIASGGCTALSLLDDAVEHVFAVDSNVAQCALVELRKAAIAAFDRDDYLAFIGEREVANRSQVYARISERLPSFARSFWDTRQALIASGINHAGTTERFYRFVGENLTRSVVPEEVWHALLRCTSQAEQLALAERHFSGEAWNAALSVLLSKTTHLAFFPAFMFAQAREHDFGAFFADQFAAELRAAPMAGNYFLSQLLFGSYLLDHPDGAPHYLSNEGYASARRNLDKLTVVPGSLADFLGEARNVDGFFLSNVFDWASAEERERLAERMLAARRPGARLVYRHMLAEPPLPAAFSGRALLDAPLSAHVRSLERSMLYRAVRAMELP